MQEPNQVRQATLLCGRFRRGGAFSRLSLVPGLDLGHLPNKAATPERRAILVHVFEQLAVVFRPGSGVDGDRLVNRIGNLLRVPRVHDNRAIQALCGTGEFGEDHDTLAGLLTRDVLVRNLCKGGCEVSWER